MLNQERRWLTAREAGDYIHLHPKSIYRSCRAGKIPYAKVPGIGIRIDRVALDALLGGRAKVRHAARATKRGRR